MKVGDTLTVTAEDEDGNEVDLTNADIQWFMGKTELTGETDASLDVTLDMLGEELSVIVTIDGVEYTDSTLAVTVEGELAILAAEQKGAKTIEATFSEAITALDKLTVSKNGEELKQAYAAKIADDGLSATITLENRITAGTYTVTLTPADADEDPSSVTFEGEVAALGSIEFVSDYLIMKDNEYKEGYAYIKGYDQFGDEMSLSSVTVIPGYGHFRSYDATTGKITIGVDDDETNFAIVKEVPVFVTYQNGADTIPANATLKVTTMSYVQDLTFGDIYKADGSKVDDDTNPLMIGDLKSKPYVEILDVEDQYGNKLSAKDLNDQATGNTKVLFVIPDESTTSAYYSTGKFSTITEKDGTVKTILYLAAGGDMPGSMDLIITGASGQSFSKPVTVQDDPYIDTLRVNYPTLYEGTDESDALEFTAVDQYGKEIKDLFNFAPKTTDNDDSTLVFNDRNHLTGQITKITAPDKVNWVVKKDNINKKFTVSIKLDPGVKKGDTLVMTAQTAGLKVTPTNLTVGQRTNGESIDTTIDGSLKLDPQNTSFNFNKNVRFLSSNGTTMDRVENEQYPVFLAAGLKTTDANTTYTSNEPTQDKPSFFWTVSRDKEGQVTGNNTDGFTIKPSDGTRFDADGVINVAELDGVNGIVNGDEYVQHKNGTFYVTLYKAALGSDGKLNVAVIDKQSFKLTYSPTVIDGEWQLGTRYTAEIKENRNVYANDDGDYTGDNVTIRVKAYPNVGEPYYVAGKFIDVTGATSNIYNNGLKVYAKKAGTATFSVYVTEPGAKQGVYTTVKVTADDKQTATKVQKEFAVLPVAGATLNSKVGTDWDDETRTDTEWTTNAAQNGTGAVKNEVTIEDGQMTITNGNRLGEKLTLGIKDQHGIPMEDAKFFVDGQPYADFWATTDDGNYLKEADPEWTAPVAEVGTEKTGHTYNVAKHIIEVRSADDSIIQHYTIELGVTDWNYTASAETTATTVYNETQLKKAFTAGKNDTVTLGKDITLTDDFGAGVIEKDDKIIVPAEYKLDIAGHTLTVAGNLEISGEVVDINPTTHTKSTTGKVTGGGTVSAKAGSNYDVNYSDLDDDQSLHVAAGATVKVNKLGGFVYAHEDIVAEEILADAVITLDEDLDISDEDGKIPTINDGAKIKVDASSASSNAPTITLGGEEFGAKKDTTSGETEFKVDLTPAGENADALAVAGFRKTYATILALVVTDYNASTNPNRDDITAAYELVDEDGTGDLSSGAMAELTEAEITQVKNLHNKVAEYTALSTMGLTGQSPASKSTGTKFTLPAALISAQTDDPATVGTLSATGATVEVGATKVSGASVTLNGNVVTVTGLSDLTANTKVAVTLKTALGNDVKITVTTEASQMASVSVTDATVAFSQTSSQNDTATLANVKILNQYGEAMTSGCTVEVVTGEDVAEEAAENTNNGNKVTTSSYAFGNDLGSITWNNTFATDGAATGNSLTTQFKIKDNTTNATITATVTWTNVTAADTAASVDFGDLETTD